MAHKNRFILQVQGRHDELYELYVAAQQKLEAVS